MAKSRITAMEILKSDARAILADWLSELRALGEDSRISGSEVEAQAGDFLRLVSRASQETLDPATPPWQEDPLKR